MLVSQDSSHLQTLPVHSPNFNNIQKTIMKIKQYLLTILPLFFICQSLTAQQITQPETLSNYSILNMAKKGLSNNVILSKIKLTNCNFDVSTDALIMLKDNKIHDDIILAMIDKSSNYTANTAQNNNQNNSEPTNVSTQNTNNKNIPIKQNKGLPSEIENIVSKLNVSGIYYFNEENNSYIELDPTVVSGSQTKIAAGNYFGIPSGMTSKSFIDGKEANVQITTTTKPVFYFFFDSASTSLNNSNNKTGQKKENFMDEIYQYGNAQNSKAFTPNDFKLIHLDVIKNSRSFKGAGGFMSNSKIPSRYFVTYKYERISTNLYRIHFDYPLTKVSEFCFLYAGNTTNSTSEVKVFDFGTKIAKKIK